MRLVMAKRLEKSEIREHEKSSAGGRSVSRGRSPSLLAALTWNVYQDFFFFFLFFLVKALPSSQHN